MFSFPKQYGDTNTGITLSKDELRAVAEVSGIMDEDGFDFIDPRVKRECLELISIPERLESEDAVKAFRFLRRILHLLGFIFAKATQNSGFGQNSLIFAQAAQNCVFLAKIVLFWQKLRKTVVSAKIALFWQRLLKTGPNKSR